MAKGEGTVPATRGSAYPETPGLSRLVGGHIGCRAYSPRPDGADVLALSARRPACKTL